MAKITRLLLLFIFLILSISACSGGETTPEVKAQMEILSLQTTPSIEHWLTDVADCAGGIPDFGVATHILPFGELDLDQADLILRLGERRESDPFVSVIGFESMVILMGSDVPVEALTQNMLQQIFTGEIRNWSEVTAAQSTGVEINQPIVTLSYPEGHELRLLFQNRFLAGESIGSEPLIFSTEAYFQTLLEMNPYGIGYSLINLMPSGAQTLAVQDIDDELTQINVLALTAEEPTGKLRQLLLCLQD